MQSFNADLRGCGRSPAARLTSKSTINIADSCVLVAVILKRKNKKVQIGLQEILIIVFVVVYVLLFL